MKMAKLRDMVSQHPWETLGFGVLAGVWFATHSKRSGEPRGLVMGLLGAVAIQLVRERALHEMGKLARSVIADTAPSPSPPPTPYAS